jgi:hypothetical protein
MDTEGFIIKNIIYGQLLYVESIQIVYFQLKFIEFMCLKLNNILK